MRTNVKFDEFVKIVSDSGNYDDYDAFDVRSMWAYSVNDWEDKEGKTQEDLNYAFALMSVWLNCFVDWWVGTWKDEGYNNEITPRVWATIR